MKQKGQGLIEFILIIPLLIAILLGTVELALFFKASHTTQEITYEAGVIATRSYVNPANTTNPAVNDCTAFVTNRIRAFGLNTTFSTTPTITGTKPFAAYQYETVAKAANGQPAVKLMIDYRNPTQKGVVVQIIYNYRTLFHGLSFSVIGRKFTFIPDVLPITSTQIQQVQVY